MVRADSARPSVVIEPATDIFKLGLGPLWNYRELVYFLAWRDLKARYAQTSLGVAWALLQPLAMMIMFTFVFGRLANLPSDGIPYPIFAYAALVPWSFFAKSLDRGGFSVVAESNLVSKVYFPRLIVPISVTLGGLLDFAISFALLFAMMWWFGISLQVSILALPICIVLTVLLALALSLWLAAICVRYRDVGAIVPLLTQLWMFGSPVVYPVSLVPKDWLWFYNVNPMVGLLEGYRWALLGTASPALPVLAVNILVIAVLLLGGLMYFNRMERTFVDVI
ncbi:MAG: ABC transporter permease [Nitrospiraceae bacterium]